MPGHAGEGNESQNQPRCLAIRRTQKELESSSVSTAKAWEGAPELMEVCAVRAAQQVPRSRCCHPISSHVDYSHPWAVGPGLPGEGLGHKANCKSKCWWGWGCWQSSYKDAASLTPTQRRCLLVAKGKTATFTWSWYNTTKSKTLQKSFLTCVSWTTGCP